MTGTSGKEQAVRNRVQLLTVKEVADMLGVHERTCWRLSAKTEAGQGDFPRPVRIGPRTIRWRLADVEAYVATLAGEQAGKVKSSPGHN